MSKHEHPRFTVDQEALEHVISGMIAEGKRAALAHIGDGQERRIIELCAKEPPLHFDEESAVRWTARRIAAVELLAEAKPDPIERAIFESAASAARLAGIARVPFCVKYLAMIMERLGSIAALTTYPAELSERFKREASAEFGRDGADLRHAKARKIRADIQRDFGLWQSGAAVPYITGKVTSDAEFARLAVAHYKRTQNHEITEKTACAYLAEARRAVQRHKANASV